MSVSFVRNILTGSGPGDGQEAEVGGAGGHLARAVHHALRALRVPALYHELDVVTVHTEFPSENYHIRNCSQSRELERGQFQPR